MPVFGKTLFETVLDGVEPEADDETEDDLDVVAAPVRGFSTGFVFAGDPIIEEAPPDPRFGYDDFAEPWAGEAASEALSAGEAVSDVLNVEPDPELSRRMERLTVEAIREELALVASMPVAALRERRRAFARENHPDRLDAKFGEQATLRMKIANQVIDEAIRAATRGIAR